MPFYKSTKELELRIDAFLDTVAEGGLVFKEGVHAYLTEEGPDFQSLIKRIDKLEGRADTLSRDVESDLYRHSLIPEHRGDVLGLLENSDNIIDRIKTSLHQFCVESPQIPGEYHAGYIQLAEAGAAAVEAVTLSARAFFRDVDAVNDHLYKVYHFEKEADKISDALKRKIFASELELARKLHLRYFAMNVESVSDKAEEVADRLAIYSIKRRI